MSSKQTLNEIKKTESEAQAIIEKARKEREMILAQAESAGQAKIKKEKENLARQKEIILAKTRQEAKKNAQDILTKQKKEILNLEAQVKQNFLAASDFVLDQIL